MRILITGTEGYIGSLLADVLIRDGHEVTGFDTGYYRSGWLYSDPKSLNRFPKGINEDLRKIDKRHLQGLDAVVHLAELSNDPLGENNPAVTYDINHQGSLNLARVAREAGVRRFIYTSSCAVYGLGDGSFLDEQSEVNPQTAYAKCKALVENDVAKLADEQFEPVFLRNATAYGASPRMRFDIVLNNLCGIAWVTKKIAMTSDGTPWRPLVHVGDICSAIHKCLAAPRDAVFNEIFNVGKNSENYQIQEVAQIVGAVFPGCEVSIGRDGGDNRSYRVSFDKIRRHLPEFECAWTAEDGAVQLRKVFDRIKMTDAIFNFPPFTRIKQLKYLTETGQLDDQLYWRDM